MNPRDRSVYTRVRQITHRKILISGAPTLLGLVLQRFGVTVGVYRQLYQHCSEPLEPMAPVDCGDWARTLKTAHIYGDTLQAQARVVWKRLYGE
jgi:hypothetical protein